MDHEYIVSGIPGEFFKLVQQGIRKGYYVTTDIAGYPTYGTGTVHSIRLSKGPDPELRFTLSEATKIVTIEAYDVLTLLLDFQTAVLQGFDLDIDSVTIYTIGHSFMTLSKPDKVTFDLGAATTEPEATESTQKPKRKKKEI